MKMKFLIWVAIVLAFNLSVRAHDFYSVFGGDTIYYNITSSVFPYTVSVGCKGEESYSYPNEYNGYVFIPDSVYYHGNYYRVTSIKSNAFECCYELLAVYIPNSVVKFGSNVFYDCTKLSEIEIPSSVFEIGLFCFNNTPWYNALPDGVMYVNNVLYQYKGICTEDLYLNVREGCVAVSYNAFCYNSHLMEVNFPSSMVSIGDVAFADCYNLKSISCAAATPPVLGRDVFKDVDKTIPLYVPQASIDLYKNADQWKDFTNVLIGLNDVKVDNNVNVIIYPNPSKDRAKISIDNLNSKVDIIVYDIKGREVKRDIVSKGTKEMMLDVSDLNRGVYFIRIVNKTIDETKKLVVE